MQLTGIIHTGSKDGKARSSPSPSVRFSIAERRTFSAPHIDLHEPLRNQGGIFSPSSRSNNSSLFSFSPLRTQSPTSAQDSRPWLARVDSKHVQSTKHTVGDSLHRSSTSSSSYSSPSSFKAKSTTPKSTTPSRTRSKSPSFRASITAATPTTPTTSTAATPATLGRPATPSSTNIITATPPSPFVTTTTATTSSSIIITTTPPAKKSTTTSPGRSRRKQRDSSQPDVVKLIQNLRCPIGKFNTQFNNSSNNNDDNAKEHSNEEETSLSTNHNNNNNNSNTRGRSESPSYSSRPQSRLSSRPESRQSTMRFVNEIVEIAEESTRTIPKVNEDEEEIFSPQELRLPPAERLQIVEEKIRQYKEQGMYDKIIQLRVHAMALMRLVYGDDSADLAYSFFDIGVNYMNMRAYEQALPHLTKALSTFSNVNYVPSKQQQQQQQPYQQQQQDVDTDTGYHLQQQQRAPSRPSSAARSRPASAMSHHSSTSAPMMMMGNNNNNKKDHQTTTTATKQLLPQVLLMLGICYMQLKMYKKAHVVLKEAVTQSEMIFGRSHASCFPSCCALAKYYSLTKNHKLALEYLRKAWEVKEAETGSVHADIAELYKEMSMIHKMDNQLTEATEMMRRAKEVYVQLHGLSSIEAGDTAFSIGELLFESGNPEEARKEFVFAAEAFREQYGENDERTVCIDKQIALMDVDAMLKKQEQKKQKQNQKQNKQPERKPSEDEYGGNNNNDDDDDDDDYDLDQDEDEDPRGSDNAHDHHHHHHRHHPHRRMDDDNDDDDDDDAGDLKQRFEAGIELLQDVLQRECDIYGEVHEAVAVSYEALADAYEFKKDFSNASLLFEKSIGIYERLSYEQQKKKYARKIRQLSKRLEHVESLAMEQEFSTRAPG